MPRAVSKRLKEGRSRHKTRRTEEESPRRRASRTADHAIIKARPIADWFSGKCFSLVHGKNLVYNTCWEDPRLDRQALNLTPDDTVMVITSAGCNALDYALCGPKRVYTVDMNPRQNALLELKVAAIRSLDYETFFSLFGRGRLPGFEKIFEDKLRKQLSPFAQKYWERYANFFTGRRSFYYRGSSGAVAQFCMYYVDKVAKIRTDLDQLLDATSVDDQRHIYERSVRRAFWTGFMKKVIGSDTTLSMLGVPRQQRQQVEHYFGGGISEFIEECVETVFARLPIHDNYFWRVYLKGEYTPDCCPEYLKPENFEKLKGGLVDRIDINTDSVEAFLRKKDVKISRYILLDHMDWLSTYRFAWLESEWQAIVDRAADNCRVLFRSGGMQVKYVDPIRVNVKGRERLVGDMMTYHTELAASLHKLDRVHTYGSFYIADLKVG